METCIAVWNILGGERDWSSRRRQVADVLKEEDVSVVVLVEAWHFEGSDQAADLARLLGMEHWCAADVAATREGHWGVAVASRSPIISAERFVLSHPSNGSPPGVALIATVRGPNAVTFDVVAVCEWGNLARSLFGPSDHDLLPGFEQLATMLSCRRRDLPPVVAGDLNASPECDELRILTGRSPSSIAMHFNDVWELANGAAGGWTLDCLSNPRASDIPGGRHRIDYILTGVSPNFERSWQALEARLIGTQLVRPPSDHYGLVATLRAVPLQTPYVAAGSDDCFVSVRGTTTHRFSVS